MMTFVIIMMSDIEKGVKYKKGKGEGEKS